MELFKLLGTIAIENTEANKAIDDTTGKAEKSEGKISGAFGKIGNAAVKVGKVAAVGLGVAATAVAGLAKKALDGYADYEQLVGGVETLFGAGGQSLEEYAKSIGKTVDEAKGEYDRLMGAQETVLKNADIAYKTAGMSANEYMETVTGFSAALIKSLGGDTEKAAEKANQALIDMSDNANKMGSDMESIKNAYSGFAKQNYTMLDNLKLGYGGTQEEMKRLLADAQAISGIEYDISSYADVVDAIHVIQEEMGIAGTTAKEASSTISGSISAMKSSWENLVAGLGNEDANLSNLVEQFADSVVTVAGNVVPRIGVILSNIGEVAVKSVPKLINKISTSIIEALPTLADKIASGLSGALGQSELSNAFSDSFKENLLESANGIYEMAVSMKDSVFETFSSNFSEIKEAIQTLQPVIQQLVGNYITNLVNGFQTAVSVISNIVIPIFNLVSTVITDVATKIAVAIMPTIGKISDKFTELSNVVNDVIQSYILPAIQSFIQMLQDLWNENQDKITAIGELFDVVFQTILNMVSWFTDVFKSYIAPFLAWLCEAVMSNMDNIKGVFQAVFDVIGGIVQFFVALFKGDWEGMWEAVKTILNGGKNYIVSIFNVIKSFLGSIGSGIASIVRNAFEKVRSSIQEKLTDAKKKVVDIFTSIKEKINEKMEDAKSIVSKAVQKFKDFFNFEWKLPKIKLPHFSISGSFSLNPPKVPSFGIEWYKNGGIMNNPTAFGINPSTGKMMVGGEAGAEAIAPIDTLQKYIVEAVGEKDSQVVEAINEGFNQLINLLMQYIPQLLNMQLVMDSGAVVGELAPQMDVALGKLAIRNKRGV